MTDWRMIQQAVKLAAIENWLRSTGLQARCDRLVATTAHNSARAARNGAQMASDGLENADRQDYYLLFKAEVMSYVLRAMRGVPAGQDGVVHKWRSGPALQTCISSPIMAQTG